MSARLPDASKTTKRSGKSVDYPIAETLRWVADGEKLLIQWGAIKSPGAKRIANGVGQGAFCAGSADGIRKV